MYTFYIYTYTPIQKYMHTYTHTYIPAYLRALPFQAPCRVLHLKNPAVELLCFQVSSRTNAQDPDRARNNPKVSASAAKALSRQSLQTLPTLATLNKHPHSIAALAQDIARIPNPTSPSSSRICLAVMLCPARAQALMAAPQATTYGCKASSPDMCTIHTQI